MALGDQVRVTLDAGGSTEVVTIAAEVRGRRLRVREVARVTLVVEEGKTGKVFRVHRFPHRRVVGIEELPVRQPSRQRRPGEHPGQTTLDDFLDGSGEQEEEKPPPPVPAPVTPDL